METLITMAAGAACVGLAWLGMLVTKHGWASVKTRFAARAAAAEAALKADAEKVLGPRLTAIEADIAALKAKVGI